MIVAGETSGDLHGSSLVKNMRKIDPTLKFIGMGGHRMQNAGVENIFNIDDLDIVGVSEAFRGIFKIRKRFNKLCKIMDNEHPELVILIDYPGFNLRLAKQAKKRDIKVAYYISPQLWAWGKGRIKTVKACVDKMIVILPFEEDFYKGYNVPVEFVGHPLLDIVKTSGTREEILTSLDITGKPVVGLLPGSRKQEVAALLPKMLETARVLHKKGKIQKAKILKAAHLSESMYRSTMTGNDSFIELSEMPIHTFLPQLDLALVASGTATLEVGYFNVPMVIVYHVNALTYWLARWLVKIDHIGLVNIVAEKEVAKELIQDEFSVQNAVQELSGLAEPRANERMRETLRIIREKLGGTGASRRAAEAVFSVLDNENED